MKEELKKGIIRVYKEIKFIHFDSDFDTVLDVVYKKARRINTCLLTSWLDLDIITYEEYSELEALNDSLADSTIEFLHK